MWTVSFRLRRGILAALAIIVVIVIVLFTVKSCTKPDASAEEAPQVRLTGQTLKNNDQRLAFMRKLGWEVNPTPIETAEVAIPDPFDAVYEQYNQIQLAQGLDLSDFMGVKVKHYCYEVLNYPDEPSDVRINLFVYKDKLIAGDVCSVRLDGFMQGLQSPKTPAVPLTPETAESKTPAIGASGSKADDGSCSSGACDCADKKMCGGDCGEECGCIHP